MSDRGQGIRLFSTEQELHTIFQQWERDQSDSEEENEESVDSEGQSHSPQANDEIAAETRTQYMGKKPDGIITSQLRHFVVQPYIHPLLLPEHQNRKFHIRTYVLCVGALRVYIYKEMLALFAA
ncbi:MAG: hypothetical protein L6R39_005192, partial [Caloplaca ligustica]